MDKIKRFIDCGITTETCNLRCHYCYITQKRKFNNRLVTLPQPVETIAKALSKERLGGSCLFNMCAGGETLLSNEVLPLVRALIEEGHYVMIVTNGTITQRFHEIAEWPKAVRNKLFIKFSFHYLELMRLKWIDRFFENVALMKNNGVSFTVEVMPSDELIPHVEDLKKVCKERLGALCHVTVARDETTAGFNVLSSLDFDEYKTVWMQFESDLFEFKASVFYQKRREFCYAGDWSLFLSLGTGDVYQCPYAKKIDNIFRDIHAPLQVDAVGHDCPLAHCYNAHAYLTLGVIPEINSPTYAQVRNRICADGTHWLQPEMAQFMGTRLYDSNTQYSLWRKGKINIKNAYVKLRRKAGSLKRRLLKW